MSEGSNEGQDQERRPPQQFRAPDEVMRRARKTTQLAENVAKVVSKTKPKKVPPETIEKGMITVDMEKAIREQVLKKKKRKDK